jgi:hypothetical protein
VNPFSSLSEYICLNHDSVLFGRIGSPCLALLRPSKSNLIKVDARTWRRGRCLTLSDQSLDVFASVLGAELTGTFLCRDEDPREELGSSWISSMAKEGELGIGQGS